MGYCKSLFIALDQLVNAVLGGWPDETMSSRCWRWHLAGKDWPMVIVDGLFFWDTQHCRASYESERLGRQMPPELRPTGIA